MFVKTQVQRKNVKYSNTGNKQTNTFLKKKDKKDRYCYQKGYTKDTYFQLHGYLDEGCSKNP